MISALSTISLSEIALTVSYLLEIRKDIFLRLCSKLRPELLLLQSANLADSFRFR